MISVATPASLRRTASSTAISSNGFIDILTLAVSTPVSSALTRTLTLKSTTRLTATSTFIERPSRPDRAMLRRGSGLCTCTIRRQALHVHERNAARLPQHVAGAPVVEVPAQHEEMIGQAVEIFERLGVDRLGGRERGDQPLGPAHDGAREVEIRRGRACRPAGRRSRAAPTRRSWRRSRCSSRVDLGGDDAQRALGLARRSRGWQRSAPRSNRSFWMRASIASRRARGVEAGEADGGVGLVHRAVGLDAERHASGTRRRRRARSRRRRRRGCRCGSG